MTEEQKQLIREKFEGYLELYFMRTMSERQKKALFELLDETLDLAIKQTEDRIIEKAKEMKRKIPPDALKNLGPLGLAEEELRNFGYNKAIDNLITLIDFKEKRHEELGGLTIDEYEEMQYKVETTYIPSDEDLSGNKE